MRREANVIFETGRRKNTKKCSNRPASAAEGEKNSNADNLHKDRKSLRELRADAKKTPVFHQSQIIKTQEQSNTWINSLV